MADGKNKLIDQPMSQVDTYKVKPESFPMKGTKARGEASGANELADGMCESPRHLEDGGAGKHGSGTPSDWGKGGKAFSVETNRGESADGSPSKVSISYSVDFKTGQVTPDVAKIHNEEN